MFYFQQCTVYYVLLPTVYSVFYVLLPTVVYTVLYFQKRTLHYSMFCPSTEKKHDRMLFTKGKEKKHVQILRAQYYTIGSP